MDFINKKVDIYNQISHKREKEYEVIGVNYTYRISKKTGKKSKVFYIISRFESTGTEGCRIVKPCDAEIIAEHTKWL